MLSTLFKSKEQPSETCFKADSAAQNALCKPGVLEPVLCRSQMHENHVFSEFCDIASRQLLNKLGIAAHSEATQVNMADNNQRFAECQWIDQQAIAFFRQNPRAKGIELRAGLSTRFHRISHCLDWPRFTWHCVNEIETAGYLKEVFPKSENFYIDARKEPVSDWTDLINSEHAEPILLVVDGQNPITQHEDWRVLSGAIFTVMLTYRVPVHLLITYKLKDRDIYRCAGADSTFAVSKKLLAKHIAQTPSLFEKLRQKISLSSKNTIAHYRYEITNLNLTSERKNG